MTIHSQSQGCQPLHLQLEQLNQYIGDLSFLLSAPTTIDKAGMIRLVYVVEEIEKMVARCVTPAKENDAAAGPVFSELYEANAELASAFPESDLQLRQKVAQLSDQWDDAAEPDIRTLVPSVKQLHAFAVRAHQLARQKLYTENQRRFQRFAPWGIGAAATLGALIVFGLLCSKHQPITLNDPVTVTDASTGVTATFFETQDFKTQLKQQTFPDVQFRSGAKVVNPAIKKAPYSVQLSGYLTFTPQQVEKSNLWYICANHDDSISMKINNIPAVTDNISVEGNTNTVCRRVRVAKPGMYPFSINYATKDEGMLLSLLWGDVKGKITKIPNTALFTENPAKMASLQDKSVQDK